MTTAMYPGSFDPVTRGHLDIIKRASRMFDTLIVAVLNNSAKTPLFTVEERVAMLEECCRGIPNVRVASFDGLTVAFAKACGATVMVRGLRAVTDFENEIQLAHTNHALLPGIETVFLATSIKWSYLSSTIVKEAATTARTFPSSSRPTWRPPCCRKRNRASSEPFPRPYSRPQTALAVLEIEPRKNEGKPLPAAGRPLHFRRLHL